MARFVNALIGAAVAIGMAIGHAAAQEEVVFSGPGGSNQKAFLEKILPVFEQETGIKVIYNGSGVLEALTKTEAQRNNPEFDVVIVTDDGYAAFRQKDLFEELTPTIVPNINNVYELVAYPGNMGVPIFIGVCGVAYNSEILKREGIEPPTSTKALWDPRFEGRSAIWTPRSSTGISMMLAAARIFGGDENNMDPVFQKLAEIAPNVSFNRADEMTAMFQQEQIWIGWQNNTRVAQLQAQGFPIKMLPLDEGTPLFTNGVVLVKNAPNRENGIKLINFFLSDTGQKLIAEALGSGPSVKSVQLDPELAAKVPFGAAIEGGFVGNWDAIVANRAAWLDRWTREIER